MHRISLPSSRLTRVVSGYWHPVQTSLEARIPPIADRIPSLAYGARRRPRPNSALDRLREGVGAAKSRLTQPGYALPRLPQIIVIRQPRHSRPRSRRERIVQAVAEVDRQLIAGVAAGIAAGALGMYYLDRAQGRRRRALVRDRFAHLGHVFSRDVRRVERKGRFFRGVARGLGHEAAGRVHINGSHEPVDDETLVARVRSEVLRSDRWKSGEIHVDAYEGCVTLRGQVDTESDIARLADGTRHVEGVLEVRSYLHLPGTLPPNKAQSLAEGVPEYLHSS